MTWAVIEKNVVPLLKKGLTDSIPNVRFVTLRSIPNYIKMECLKGKKDFLKDHLKPDIDKLTNSKEDEDVR